MNKHAGHRPFAVAAALLVIGALAWDVPVGYVLFIGLILACPLMMIFMMRGMGAGDQGNGGQGVDAHRADQPADESAGPDNVADRR